MKTSGLIVLLLFFLIPTSGWACSCAEASLGEHYDNAKIVFYGTASTNEKGVSLKVKRSWKGAKKNAKLQVLDSPCAVAFKDDENYLVFANKKGKKITTSICAGTTQLDFEPFAPTAWTLADQPQYGLTKKEKEAHQKERNKLTDAAEKQLDLALVKCQKKFWSNSKDPVSGHVEFRIDFAPPTHTVIEEKFETSQPLEDSTRECVAERLQKAKFPKFSGGPISVRVYRVMDRVDQGMKRDRTSATIDPIEIPKL